jgi:phage terminase large subunit-like protein
MTTAKIKQPLQGALEPRLHSPFWTGKTRGDEVAAFAEKIGRPLLPWQKLIMDDLCAVDDAGKFVRRSSLLLTARQSGKSWVARMRCLAGLFLFDEQNVLIMSSKMKMSMKSFDMMVQIIEENPFLVAQLKGGSIQKGVRRANGSERILLENGHMLEVAAATADGVRGFTCDMLWLDELGSVTEDAMDAAKSVTLARPNSQRLYTSNAGSSESKVLNTMRDKAQYKPPKSFGYYEYSAPENYDVLDRAGWAMANPSLGILIDESAIEEIIATTDINSIRRETLCQFVHGGVASPWTPGSWEALVDPNLTMAPGPITMFAFDIDPHTKKTASLVCGQLREDLSIALSLVKIWEDPVAVDELQIAKDIMEYCITWQPRLVLHDRYVTSAIAHRLRMSGIAVEDCSQNAFYQACASLKEAMDNGRLVHMGQENLDLQMQNVAPKWNDNGWRIVRKSAGSVTGPIGIAMVVAELSKPQSYPRIFLEA